MSDFDCKFQDGMTIYKEGDRNRTAFVILSGHVELLKKTANGLIRIGMVAPGESFGETGIVDKSIRSVTARAVGHVVIEPIIQHGDQSFSTNEPEIALKTVGKITKSLQHTDQMLVSPASQKVLFDAQNKPNIWSLIGGLIAKRRNKKRLLEIRIAPLLGDEDGTNAIHLANTLGQQQEVRATILPLGLLKNDPPDEGYYHHSRFSVRRQLLRQENADLMIWGEVDQVALHLRFISQKVPPDQPGCFLITDRLSLPIRFSQACGDFLCATVIAAIVPRSDSYQLMMRPMLINALEAARDIGTEPPLVLTLANQASIRVCYGNMISSIGNHLNSLDYYQKAALAYQSAAECISPEIETVEWANVYYHLGQIQQILGDKGEDKEVLEAAHESYESALRYFTKADYPWEWAIIQNRLGGLFYRLDTLNSNPETLKDAVTAFQSSLKIITRELTPLKWSEVKNNLGQVLQIWGDTAQNRELLEAAVQCCQDALQVRNREETPLPWAATQNNLGSALFLLGRHMGRTEPLEQSTEAFARALSIYTAYGADRLKKVAKRNMRKAEQLLISIKPRPSPKLKREDQDFQMGQKSQEQYNKHA